MQKIKTILTQNQLPVSKAPWGYTYSTGLPNCADKAASKRKKPCRSRAFRNHIGFKT